MDSSIKHVGAKPRKPRKPRVLTEKRKEQNRIHQRLYRKRQKGLTLETQNKASQKPFVALKNAQSLDFDVALEAETGEFNISLEGDETYALQSLGTPVDEQWSNINSPIFNFSTPPALGSGLESYSSSIEQNLQPDSADFIDFDAFSAQSVTPQHQQTVESEIPASSQDESFQYGQVKLSIDGTLEVIRTNAAGTIQKYPLHLALREILDTLRCHKGFKRHAIKASHSRSVGEVDARAHDTQIFRRKLTAWVKNCPNIKNIFSEVEPYTADPVANHIRLHRVNLLAACLANSSMLGADIHMIPESYDSSHGEVVSPIWETWSTLGDTAKVLEVYSNISGDLQPCVEQIEQKHGIYIDLIPFPDFRKRVLSARNVSPPLFSEKELCHDIDDGGLVCWGSRGTGTPWEMRSWEARPWFLKKWWMLTGGRESEMYVQSKVSKSIPYYDVLSVQLHH